MLVQLTCVLACGCICVLLYVCACALLVCVCMLGADVCVTLVPSWLVDDVLSFLLSTCASCEHRLPPPRAQADNLSEWRCSEHAGLSVRALHVCSILCGMLVKVKDSRGRLFVRIICIATILILR